MSLTVWKFSLRDCENRKIEMPFPGKVLSAAFVDGEPVVYALVDTLATAKVAREITITMTGQPAPSSARFVGSVVWPVMALVLHVWTNP